MSSSIFAKVTGVFTFEGRKIGKPGRIPSSCIAYKTPSSVTTIISPRPSRSMSVTAAPLERSPSIIIGKPFKYSPNMSMT